MSTPPAPDTPHYIEMPLAPPGQMGPPPEYTHLRTHCPYAKLHMPPDMAGLTTWYITRYTDVRELLADHRLIRPTINDWPPTNTPQHNTGPGLTTLMEMDGPQHLATRRALADAFSTRTIRTYQPRLRQLADSLLDDFTATHTTGDIVAGFAEPFPLQVMCDLVGIPYTDRDHYLPMADLALGAMQTLEEGRKVTDELRTYICTVIDNKRTHPTDDILTHLVHTADNGHLDQESVISFGLSMLIAGYRTTTMFLANALHTLLTNPDHYTRLRDHRDIMPTAIDELLRYIPVMNGVVVLLATEDIHLPETTIHAGQSVLPVIAAANRDDTTFTNPDTLDLTRTHNPHLAFGRGTHSCLGNHLARAELTTALHTILDRLPHLHLINNQPPTWDDQSPAKSPITLPVGW